MSELQRPQLQPIYDRLHSAPQYHPLDANTFSDWSMEAGDVITVTRDGQSYQSPVHTSKMTWRKKQKISVSSTGNEKRESIAKMSQNKFNESNSSSLRNATYQRSYASGVNRRMLSGLELNDSYARLYVKDAYDRMQAGLELTSSTAHLYVEDKYNQMTAGLALTASTAALYVEDKYNQMVSGLSLTRSSWALSVAGVVDAYGKVTAASIVGKINENGSNVNINADHVYVDSTQAVKLNGVLSITDGAAVFSRTVMVTSGGGVVSINGGKVSATTLQGGQLTLTQTDPNSQTNVTQSIGVATLKTLVKGVSTANNVLTLTMVDGTTKTFSKATALSQDNWSSGHLRVLAKQTNYDETTETNKETQVNNYDVYLIDSNTKENLDGTAYTAGNNEWYVPVHAKTNPSSQTSDPTGLRIHVNASDIRTAGKNDVSISEMEWDHDGDYFSLNHNSTNTIKNHTTGRPTQVNKQASINMTQDANWASNGKKWVYVRQGTSSSGQYVCGLEVTAPAQKVLATCATAPQITSNGIHFPPSGYDGWSEIDVAVPASAVTHSPSVSSHYLEQYDNNGPGTIVKSIAKASCSGSNSSPHTIYIYLEQDGNAVYAMKDGWSGTKVGKCTINNYHPTQHNNCAKGLTRYNNGNLTELFTYVPTLDRYVSAGQKYWYYKDSAQALTAYWS